MANANMKMCGFFAIILLSILAQLPVTYSINVTYDSRALLIDGQRRLLLSAGIHYPRSSPAMWPSILKKARESGCDVVQTYVFWNGHEPQPRQYNFEGRYDLVKFIRAAAAANLFVTLRIGPYVCAEWNHGGFPFWLREVPGVEFRADNGPFKAEMERFTRLVVDKMRAQQLLAWQGGPIILLQIENEYGNVEAQLPGGKEYAQWAASMAVGLQAGVPWIMCNQPDAPPSVISTCNGFYCDQWQPHAGQPKMWTEDWAGWYAHWGEAVPRRPVQDLAFAVARFFALGGALHNYYMFFGGTTFARETGGPLIVTSYDYDAPLDEFGVEHNPKFGHLKELHLLLKACESAIMADAPAQHFTLASNAEAHVYGPGAAALRKVAASASASASTASTSSMAAAAAAAAAAGGGCAAFLSNFDSSSDASVEFNGRTFVLPAWSVSILPDCRTVAFRTDQVSAQTTLVMKRPVVTAGCREPPRAAQEPPLPPLPPSLPLSFLPQAAHHQKPGTPESSRLSGLADFAHPAGHTGCTGQVDRTDCLDGADGADGADCISRANGADCPPPLLATGRLAGHRRSLGAGARENDAAAAAAAGGGQGLVDGGGGAAGGGGGGEEAGEGRAGAEAASGGEEAGGGGSSSSSSSMSWVWVAEPVGVWGESTRSPSPVEQLSLTRDSTDYLWYTTTIPLPTSFPSTSTKASSSSISSRSSRSSSGGSSSSSNSRSRANAWAVSRTAGREWRRSLFSRTSVPVGGLALERDASGLGGGSSSSDSWRAADEPGVSLNLTMFGDAAHIFLNGKLLAGGVKGPAASVPLGGAHTLAKGSAELAVLSLKVGLQNYGAHLERERAGLLGDVLVQGVPGEGTINLTAAGWRHQVGLKGEALKLSLPVSWEALGGAESLRGAGLAGAIRRPLTWLKAEFCTPTGDAPVAVDLGTMGKGFFWVNGHALGRYWPTQIAPASPACTGEACDWRGPYSATKCLTGCGHPTQRWYHIPREYLRREGPNAMVLFEETGGDPSAVVIALHEPGRICRHMEATKRLALHFMHDPVESSNSSDNTSNAMRTSATSANTTSLSTPAGVPAALSSATSAAGPKAADVELRCAPGQQIYDIEFASYGRPEGACSSFSESLCHAPSSRAIVREACLGREKCRLSLEAARWGVPELACMSGGASYSLAVQVLCRPSRWDRQSEMLLRVQMASTTS